MRLTDQQKRAVHREHAHALLTACPGSGKTRVIVAKLLRCIDEVRGTARRIACITYTNAAVYEIEARLRRYGRVGDDDYYLVSTIHAFCLNEVLRHFYWYIPAYSEGFCVAPPDSDIFVATAQRVCRAHGITYAKVAEHFELLNRQPTGQPIVAAGSDLSAEAVQEFWTSLSDAGYLDFPNIVYLAYNLMHSHDFIARAVSCRFAWLLVDEFQDTSALQVEILKLIAAYGHTRFFLVGDPLQSIFGFAGARPDLMDTFAEHIVTGEPLELTGNFRSSDRIIAHAERLCPRVPSMVGSGPHASCEIEPAYHHVNEPFDAITDYFLPALEEHGIPFGRAAILAPWWIKLLFLGRQLRDYGVPIVGPGARPYKRSHLFALLAENICACIEWPSANLIPVIEKELFNLILQVCGKPNLAVCSYAGRVCVYRLLEEGRRLRLITEGAIDWLQQAAQVYGELLSVSGFLPASVSELLTQSVDEMQADMVRNKVDVANLAVADLGLFANPKESLKLLTMHRAKGREFDAVAIVDMHDGRVPHYSAETEEEVDEGRRLLYVAITRAKRVLMYVTDQENWRNRPSRFLGDEGIGVV